ncbi:hypothetical protein RvY_01030 [Ramazzottius varieornatus]|uniref:Putative auto-transporter adhesin head GIN domain-containing protein n=1 Tax=Ramazzottius varieornatus TaxID=947166 RepID=A0A1D1UEV9_RAMVA|nr:hypothetical protein RvY_01030 [Ramazzottius varieornatus]
MATSLFLSAILMAFSASPCRGQRVTEDRPVTMFRSISNKGPFNVIITMGTTEAVRVEADPTIIKYVETVVEPWFPLVLQVRFSNLLYNQPIPFFNGPINVYASAKALSNLENQGSGPISLSPFLKAGDLQILISGSGDVQVPMEASGLNIVISGSGNFFTNGTARNANINISGSGNFNGRDLRTQQTNVNIQGSGDVEVYTSTSLTVNIDGSGDVRFGGQPRVSQQINGSGGVFPSGTI